MMQVIFYILLNIIHQVNLRCICRAINRCGYGIIQTKKNIPRHQVSQPVLRKRRLCRRRICSS